MSDPASRRDDASALLRLDRRDRQLWIIASLVMTALAAALVVVYLARAKVAQDGPAAPGVTGTDVATPIALGLLALVGLFSAYLFSKRRQIRRLQAAVIEEQAQNRDLAGRLENLQRLIRAARGFDVVPTVRNLLPRVTSEAVRLVGADRASVWLRGEGGAMELMDCFASDGQRPDTAAEAPHLPGDERAQPELIVGEEAIAERVGDGDLARGCGSMIVCPLRTGGRPFGVLAVQRLAGAERGAFTEEHLSLLWILAGFASYVLTVARTQARQREINRELRSSMVKLQTAQERLVQVEKLTAVGELVSGVAHEINNPLTSLLGYAQLLASLGPDKLAENRHFLDEIQKEALRCSGIVQNLASFARPPSDSGSQEGLASVVESTLGLKAYALRSGGVDLSVDVPVDLPAPALDRSLVQQVLLNLINNALFALRDAETPRIRLSGRVGAGRVQVVVSDNGCGIPREHLGQIFEPFFSTRPKNEGIGLGLHTCVSILSDNGGSIAVASREGEGTSFTVSLPVAPVALTA